MTGREAYQIWAPTGKKWTDWVRPVPFIEMKEEGRLYGLSDGFLPMTDFPGLTEAGTAVIVDLPGAQSVKEGIALARKGYRPIPIYNGTIQQPEARATVDNGSVGLALGLEAAKLQEIDIPEDAMPAFLLDSNRLHRYKMEISLFDNSWDVYPQDMPSAEYMWANGVRRIIVIGDALAKDLKKLLYPYQKNGMEILWTQGYEAPKKKKIVKSLRWDKD